MSCTEAEKARGRRRYQDPGYRAWKKEYNRQYLLRKKAARIEVDRPPPGWTDCEGNYHIGI